MSQKGIVLSQMVLHNRHDKRILKEKLANEEFKRITVSFYRYVIIDEPIQFRDELYKRLDALQVFGRVYIANEGFNAQISVPEMNYDQFISVIEFYQFTRGVSIKRAIEDDGKSFYKLKIKVRKKIVADGLNDQSFDVTNVGRHLNPQEFHDKLGKADHIVVDMRNFYESEVGHFENALKPDVETFRELLDVVPEMLAAEKEKEILLYCTGGIRCEKASAFLKHKGFEQVYQLDGGIIQYADYVKEQGLDSKFIGKNFVFDSRLGERITDDVIANCHVCGAECDAHTNCANDDCHLLFIQCDSCKEKLKGCCSEHCKEVLALPEEEQIRVRKDDNQSMRNFYKSRIRPRLKTKAE